MLEDENRSLRNDLAAIETQLTSERADYSDQTEQLRRQVGELQQQLQQSHRRNASVNQSGGASELIRARALEAAREEIKELREAHEATKADLDKVIEGRKHAED